MEVWPDPEGVSGPSHPLVEKFRAARREDPEPKDQFIDALKALPGYKVKIGRWRGATWYDREVAAVFLVAAGWREQGNPDDFYREAAHLLDQGVLWPSESDYEELDNWRAGRWLREIRDKAGPRLIADAVTQPEVPHELHLGRCVAIAVAYPVADRHIILIRLDQPDGGEYLTPNQAALIAQAIAMHTQSELSTASTWNGRPLPYNAYAFELIA